MLFHDKFRNVSTREGVESMGDLYESVHMSWYQALFYLPHLRS